MYNIPKDVKLYILSFLNDCNVLNWKVINNEWLDIYLLNKNSLLEFVKIGQKNKISIDWRKRPNEWTKIYIKKIKKHFRTIKINSFTNGDIKNVPFLNSKYYMIKDIWKIYDNTGKYIAFLNLKNSCLYRPNKKKWAIFKVKFSCKISHISLVKLNSLEYENPVNKENEIIIKNEIPMKSSNKKNKLLYLKFDNIDINKASIKNSKYINIDSKDCVFEIGKNYLDEIMIFYKKPLHGLIAFAICILKLLN